MEWYVFNQNGELVDGEKSDKIMTLQQFLSKYPEKTFVIKNKYCVKKGDFSIAGKAKFIINNLTYNALQKNQQKLLIMLFI